MTPAQLQAKRELDKMQRSLSDWLKYRAMVNAVVAGKLPTAYQPAVIAQIVEAYRDVTTEQRLANELRAFLSTLHDQQDFSRLNAEELARVAVTGQVPASGPSAQGLVPLVWLIMVGGVVVTLATAVTSYADVLKERDRLALCKAGIKDACGTPWLHWLAAGGVVYFLWRETALLDGVKAWVGAKR